MKHSFLMIPLLALLLCGGCAKATVPHPGQVDAVDGKGYDTLIVSQAAINEAKVQLKAGKLPESAKPTLNAAIAAYNELHTVWLAYRANPEASVADKVIAATVEINRLILLLRGMIP